MSEPGPASPSAPRRWPDAIGARLARAGSPTQLALVRIVFALHVATVLVSPALPLINVLGAQPLLLTQTVVPGPLELWTRQHVDLLVAIGVGAAAATVLGLLTRVALPILWLAFTLTQSYFFRHSLFHDDWLYFTFYLLVLCFAPCADRLSLDRWLRPRPDRPPAAYRWPVEVMIGWFALIYVAAATAKLFPLRKGILWLGGVSLQHFALHFMHASPVYWIAHRPLFDYSLRWPFCIGAILTVTVELSAALLWLTRRYDAIVVPAIIGMHCMIWMLGIPGFVQIALVSSLLFLRPRP